MTNVTKTHKKDTRATRERHTTKISDKDTTQKHTTKEHDKDANKEKRQWHTIQRRTITFVINKYTHDKDARLKHKTIKRDKDTIYVSIGDNS